MTNCARVRTVKLNPEALRVIRERSGLTKTELADRAGVHQSLITRLENGQRVGTPKVIAHLAAALDVSQLAICSATESEASEVA